MQYYTYKNSDINYYLQLLNNKLLMYIDLLIFNTINDDYNFKFYNSC